MRIRCANCRRVLMSGDKQHTSSVYGTHGACTLCDACAKVEEQEIEKKQSNDVPTLLILYLGERRKTPRVSQPEPSAQ